MELLQLRYFDKVAETQHMTRAAEELHIAQPSLSKTIKLLENELGVSLFDRKGKYIVLNDAGRIFQQYTSIALNALESAKKELNDYKTTENAIISISIRVAPVFVADLIAQFSKQYPSVRFLMKQHQYLRDHLPENQCDITFFSSLSRIDSESSRSLAYEDILLEVPHGHPWANRTAIPMRELAGEKLVLSIPADSALRLAIDEYCKIAGFQPKIVMEVDDARVIHQCVQKGIGLALVPKISWMEAQKWEHEAAFISLAEPRCGRYINMRWKTTGYVSKAAVLFREFVIQHYRNYVEK